MNSGGFFSNEVSKINKNFEYKNLANILSRGFTTIGVLNSDLL